jgi:hypothetical protein
MGTATKDRTSGSFRIPGLGGDSIIRKTGMSATSSARVVTFLPTPLFPSKAKDKPEQQIQQFSSPASSPRTKFSSQDTIEDMDGLHYRSSSPPTSDPVADDNDIQIHWNPDNIRQQYADLSQRAKEV